MSWRRVVAALLPLAWTLAIAIPATYATIWLIESIYEVPIEPDSFRFERPWAWLLLLAAPLVLVTRGWLEKARAPRLQISRGGDVARGGRGWRIWARHATTRAPHGGARADRRSG